ncbi:MULTISPECIES: asparagine synthase (glutamine-hydrolyzing) [unclassified Paenibacillus]|uniref:asparagine synthase (glutamine-hydrolyzing) n=1 Tax=unclassified Paenibacillus TaxID=185978 RepID=UPI0036364020
MCGITGIIIQKQYNRDIEHMLLNAQKVQGHRGPDSQGFVIKDLNNWKVGFGHQRLSILDLSNMGDQPMCFKQEFGSIIYNGEVYNYKELKLELEQLGHRFKSDTDTEVVLTALNHWGPLEALSKFNGMWAFAWLDPQNNRLILARDRAGVKPLNYYLYNNQLYLASEVKTILEMAPNKFTLNNQLIGEYLVQSLLETTTNTLFEGIKKIPAAHFCEIDLSTDNIKLDIKPYWTITTDVYHFYSEEKLIEEIRELFIDAVRLRLRSDVPVGVLLSGGIDSSSIAAVMQQVLGRNSELNLLSAVSTDARYDESKFINIMGKHLNRDVHKVVLDFHPNRAFDYLEEVCWFNDEPVGSFSNVAHYLLMKQASEQNIKVILSGQGADELLCGYKKYLGFYIQSLVNQGRYIEAGKTLGSFYKQGTILSQFNIQEAKRYMPQYLKPRELDIRGESLEHYMPKFVGLTSGMTVIERQALDIKHFSIPVLTHYEDRMSMAWSREVRVPFLDYRLIELLNSVPTEFKLKKGWTKYIFRKVMEPMLPPEITWRKDKQGFINPESEWLKKELRIGVLKYFGQESLMFKYGLVNRENLMKKYELYCKQPYSGGNIWFKDIFNPLALEIWLRKFEKHLA